MPDTVVFQYQDARRFLQDWLSERQKEDPAFSVRKWSSSMELSHALVVMLLQGKRGLRLKHVPAFAKGMGLSTPERLYLQALIELGTAESAEERLFLQNWLADLNPVSDFSIREVEEFKAISSWLHMGVLSACDLAEKISDVESLVAKFRARANPHEIRAAVSRLLSLGLLKRDGDGNFAATYGQVRTRDDVATEAVTTYHREVSELAAQAVVSQSVDEREFQSFALALHPSQLPLVKDLFRKFRSQLAQALDGVPATEVYNINLQLFRLTERSPDSPRVEDEGVDTEILSAEGSSV